MSDIEEKLGLSRQKLIALSLLCGCDYNDKGVLGVGKETALKFLKGLKDDEVLSR
jgi:flap endonuclease GEN